MLLIFLLTRLIAFRKCPFFFFFFFSHYRKGNLDYLLDVQFIFINKSQRQRCLTLNTWAFVAGEQSYQGEENLEFGVCQKYLCVHALHPTAKLLALACRVTDHSQNFPHPDLEWGLISTLPHPRRADSLPICWIIALPLSHRSCSALYE